MRSKEKPDYAINGDSNQEKNLEHLHLLSLVPAAPPLVQQIIS